MISSCKKHLLIAGFLLAFEAWLGIGLLGGGIGVGCAIVFGVLVATDKQNRSQHARKGAIYSLLLVSTLGLLSASARLAQRRATPVISAVNRYRSEHGQYPRSLSLFQPTCPRFLRPVLHASVGISCITTAGHNCTLPECSTVYSPMISPRNHGQQTSRAE